MTDSWLKREQADEAHLAELRRQASNRSQDEADARRKLEQEYGSNSEPGTFLEVANAVAVLSAVVAAVYGYERTGQMADAVLFAIAGAMGGWITGGTLFVVGKIMLVLVMIAVVLAAIGLALAVIMAFLK